MKNRAFQVAIIGGGMGGLCLANGLKRAGIGVAVYERDQSPDSRPQGYRIHIDPQGSTALHACLPQHSVGSFLLHGWGLFAGLQHCHPSTARTPQPRPISSKPAAQETPLPGIGRSAASPCGASCWRAWNMTCNSTNDFCVMKKLPMAPSARILKTAAAPRRICWWLPTASTPAFANNTCPMPSP